MKSTSKVTQQTAAESRRKAEERMHPIILAIDHMGTHYGMTPIAEPGFASGHPMVPTVRVALRGKMGDIAMWLEFHANARPEFVVKMVRDICEELYAIPLAMQNLEVTG